MGGGPNGGRGVHGNVRVGTREKKKKVIARGKIINTTRPRRDYILCSIMRLYIIL